MRAPNIHGLLKTMYEQKIMFKPKLSGTFVLCSVVSTMLCVGIKYLYTYTKQTRVNYAIYIYLDNGFCVYLTYGF